MEDIQTVRIFVFGIATRKVDTVYYKPFWANQSSYLDETKD